MIYLASRSSRRKDLLEQIGVPYTQLVGDVNEVPLSRECAKDYVVRMAIEKGKAGRELKLQKKSLDLPVLAADTCVVYNGEILGKPKDSAHAYEMLLKLRGDNHQVMTAVSLTDNQKTKTSLSISNVVMAQVSDEHLRDYIASGESMDKAGSYAIQGFGATLIESIDGSYSGIVGLPLYNTAKLLEDFGVNIWQNVF